MATLSEKFLPLVKQIRDLIPYDAVVAERKCLNLIKEVRKIPPFTRSESTTANYLRYIETTAD